jgi:hypothetical protein
MRLAALKREEELVREEAERLALEKQRHVRALKRLRDEVRDRRVIDIMGGRSMRQACRDRGGEHTVDQ